MLFILLKSDIFKTLNNSPYFNVLTVIIGSFTLPILIALLPYYKFKKRPVFLTNSSTLINKIIPNLKISFDNIDITDNLTITTITFSNEGKKMIDGTTDIYTNLNDNYISQNVIFSISDNYKILNARCSNVINNDNNYNLITKDHYVEFSFNNVGYKEGCTVEIIHTGLSNSIKINGTLKGTRSKKLTLDKNISPVVPTPITMLVIMITISLIKLTTKTYPDMDSLKIFLIYLLLLICNINFVLKPLLNYFKKLKAQI